MPVSSSAKQQFVGWYISMAFLVEVNDRGPDGSVEVSGTPKSLVG